MKLVSHIKRDLLIIAIPVFIGAILRLAWLLYNPHVIVADEVEYQALALKIAHGLPYGIPFWPPGWPMVLGILYRFVGDKPAAGLWFNLAISILTIVLCVELARRMFDWKTALISAWIIALMPSFILPIVLLRYEVLLQFLIILGIWIAFLGPWTWRKILAIAVITALLTLMRPFWLLLPPFLWICSKAQQIKTGSFLRLAAAQFGAILLILPWLIYAAGVSGRFVPIALNGGINLWIGNNPKATGAYINPPGEFWSAQSDAAATHEALKYIIQHPGRTLQLLPLKIWYSVKGEPWSEWVFLKTNVPFDPQTPSLVLLVLNLYYLPVLFISLISIIILALKQQYRKTVLLLPLLFTIASQLPYFGTPRFRWTVQFILIVYAAALPYILEQSKNAEVNLERTRFLAE